jgi:two-component system CheB/CheR fusion protein
LGLVDTANLGDYASILRSSTNEVGALANDLMINVTGFFRDPEAWEALRTSVVAPMIASKQEGQTVRCWVSACASGEEAYTMAMLIAEELTGREHIDVKIFATDTADRSLALARAGIYPGGIEADLTPKRLDRFSTGMSTAYRVKERSARHGGVRAPGHPARSALLAHRHLHLPESADLPRARDAAARPVDVALRVTRRRLLFLGNTESYNGSEHLFEVISKKWRIYRRTGSAHLRFAGGTRAPAYAACAMKPRATPESMQNLDAPRPSPRCSSSARCSSTTGRPPWSSIAATASSISWRHRRISRSAGRRADARSCCNSCGFRSACPVRTVLRTAVRDNTTVSVQCPLNESQRPHGADHCRAAHLQPRCPDYYRVSFATPATWRSLPFLEIVVREISGN